MSQHDVFNVALLRFEAHFYICIVCCVDRAVQGAWSQPGTHVKIEEQSDQESKFLFYFVYASHLSCLCLTAWPVIMGTSSLLFTSV